MFNDRGRMVPCHHELWAVQPADAVESLRKQRDAFWNQLSQEERRSTVYNALQFESVVTSLHESTEHKAP
eukprot:2162307-Pleurochrysis_carterae.AAC.1